MGWYTYEGFTADAQIVSGKVWGDSEEEVLLTLEYQRIKPIRIDRISEDTQQRRWKHKHMIQFSYRLHMLLGAGISLKKALDMLVETKQTGVPYQDIREDVKRGMPLSKSIAKYGCPSIAVIILEVGESSGAIVEALEMIHCMYEEEYRLRQQVISAIMYPSFLVILMLVFIGVAIGFILPQFESVFMTMHIALPPFTAMLFSGGRWLQQNSLWLVGGSTVLSLLVWYIYQLDSIKTKVHRYAWRWIQKKEWAIAFTLVRMSQLWKLLIASGIPILQMLMMTESLWGNLWASTLQKQVKDTICQGHGFTESLRTVELGTPLVWDLLRIGEETGDMESMLEQIHTYYQGIVNRTMKRGEQLLEPIMLSIMGVIIALLVVAVMLPMFNSISGIQ